MAEAIAIAQRRFGVRWAAFLLAFVAASAPACAVPLRIVAFGDSLSAGYGLRPDEAFPAVLEKRLKKDGFDVAVENHGVSGNTTRMGLARFPAALGTGAALVILELGANDMLNNVDPRETKADLDKMIRLARGKGAPVLLAGMVDINLLRPAFKQRFDAIYPGLAAKHRLPLYPFFLEGVAGDKELTQSGGLHPTAEGVVTIVDRIAPLVEAALTTAMATPRGL